MDLSVIIVNWNVKDYLEKSLTSIYENTKDIAFEIIVVDNSSSDNSTEMLKSKFPYVNLIENRNNLGYGAANNQGIKISKGRYSLVLNPDTVILDDALKRMTDFMDKNKNVGIIGCKILGADNSISTSVRKFPTLLTETAHFLMSRRKSLRELTCASFDYNKINKVDWVSGCCLMIRKEVLEKSGYFDESLFLFGDDIDICYRINKCGYDVYYLPDAKIIHYGGKSISQANFILTAVSYKSMRQFFKKNYNQMVYFTFNYSAAAIFFSKAAILFFVYFVFAHRRKSIRRIISGYMNMIKVSFDLAK